MMPPAPSKISVAPINSGATSCTLRSKKEWRSRLMFDMARSPCPVCGLGPISGSDRRGDGACDAGSLDWVLDKLPCSIDSSIMRVFLAGAAGVIGRRLVPLLLRDGHVVVGTTRSKENAGLIERAGAVAAVVDVYDARALEE